jgi:nucleoside-diphosphate-sugar epimerase
VLGSIPEGRGLDSSPVRVVITGAAGLIGGVLKRGFGPGYVVHGLDRKRTREPGVDRVDVTRLKALDAAFAGADAVIDLAASARLETPWHEVWKNNVRGTMNALEAARRNKVGRFVYASSNHVTGMYEHEPPYSAIVAGDYSELDPSSIQLIDSHAPVRPDSAYAVGKVLGEAAARYYSEAFGLRTVCLRIGTVNPEDRPKRPRDFATLLTHADLVRLCECALRAPEDLTFVTCYGVSHNTWRFWDIAEGRNTIGYLPQDDAERLRPTVPVDSLGNGDV